MSIYIHNFSKYFATCKTTSEIRKKLSSTGFSMLTSVLTIILLGHASLAGKLENLPDEESAMLDMLIAAGDRGELPKDEPEYLDYLRATKQYEEYAKLMRIDDVSLVIPSEDARSEDIIFTKVSPLGDILLTPEQAEQARQGLKKEKYTGNRWPNNRMPYAIATGDFSRSQADNIKRRIDELSSRLRILKIVPRTNEKDYVHVISGSGCWSYIGKIGDQQSLSLQRSGCLSTGTIQHEFGHAAGLTHEHNRSDRDDYVAVQWANISRDWQSQYEKVSSNDYNINGDYEPCSAMHYPLNAPGSNKRAFIMLGDNVDHSCIGQRNGFTDTDCRKIDDMYSRR